MKQIVVAVAVFSIFSNVLAQNEAKKTDYGPFFSATIRAPGGNTTVKGIVATLSADKKTVFLETPVKPVMQMKIKFTLKAEDGTAISHEIYNTIHKVPSLSASAN